MQTRAVGGGDSEGLVDVDFQVDIDCDNVGRGAYMPVYI